LIAINWQEPEEPAARSAVGLKFNKDTIRTIIQNPQAVNPAAQMPALDLPESDIDAIADFLVKQRGGR
jgi:hypothetical protein